MGKKSRSGGLVYSTETGRICPECGQAQDACQCQENARSEIKGSGQVRVSYETKGRKGKGVTLISHLAMNPLELAKTLAECKSLCGAGGTVKDGVIEVQGDHRDTLMNYLHKQGIQAKKSGG